jgi:crossover junction endodeoxyribonuclease RusA
MELTLTIPLEPPTVNMYVRHTRRGRHYKTREAEAWASAVAVIAAGQYVPGKAHEITYTVYQGYKSRGDVDNYAKCLIDSLVGAGVIKSDASVIDLHAHKRRDRANPRTEIVVRAVN